MCALQMLVLLLLLINIKAAVRILNSVGEQAIPADDILLRLKEKHPITDDCPR